MLRAYPGLSGADLARVALLTPQTVGVIIRNLERDGAIRKTPHPVHGRVLQWTLTRRGAALLENAAGTSRRWSGGWRPGSAAKAQVDGAALAVQNRHRSAAIASSSGVMAFGAGQPAPLDWPDEAA